MTRACKVGWTIILFTLTALVAGCGSGEGPDGETNQPSPTIIVDGSSTVVRISKAAQEGFRSVDPEVTVVVDSHGTGDRKSVV